MNICGSCAHVSRVLRYTWRGSAAGLALFGVLATLCLFVEPSRADEVRTYDLAVTKIETVLPKGWTIGERKYEAIPEGHYWGQKYNGVRGDEILVQGTSDIHVSWQDSRGDWHSEAVGKEALKLYFMPSDYKESPRRFFIPKRPASARLLFEGKEFKVYGYPSFSVIESDKLKGIVRNGQSIRWPDSPENTRTLSWNSWSEDISRVLQEQSP
jgi:hypothetical protein